MTMRRPESRPTGRRPVALSVALVVLFLLAWPGIVLAQAAPPPPPPAITSVNPAVVEAGDRITIRGRNFVQLRAVSMAGLSLKFNRRSQRLIVARAPRNATRGTIVVATRGGTATSPRFVVVKPTLTIEPERGAAGSSMVVSGRGFIPGEPIDLYYGRTAVVSAEADRQGRLPETALSIPTMEPPGQSFVRVQGRFSGVPVDVPHRVTTTWPQRGLAPDGNRHNRDELAVGVTVAPTLGLDWVADVIGPARSSPVVVDDTVYVGADTGALLAIPVDCASGGSTCAARALGITGGPISGSPAVVDGIVYVGSEDGRVSAFDAACPESSWPCDPIWSAETGGSIRAAPLVADGRVFVSSDDGRLYAFDAACAGDACAPLWTGETAAPVRSSPAYHDGVVYVGSGDGFVYAFDAACAADGGTCPHLWRGWANGAVRSSPTVANGVVYAGSLDGRVHGFTVGCADDGAICRAIWRGDAGSPIESSPVVADGYVVIGASDGSVHGFLVACPTPDTGCAATWTAQTGASVRSTAAVSGAAPGGPIVFIGSDDGFVYGFPLRCRNAGRPPLCPAVWASATRGAVSAAPTIVDGVLYAASEDGTVRAWSVP